MEENKDLDTAIEAVESTETVIEVKVEESKESKTAVEAVESPETTTEEKVEEKAKKVEKTEAKKEEGAAELVDEIAIEADKKIEIKKEPTKVAAKKEEEEPKKVEESEAKKEEGAAELVDEIAIEADKKVEIKKEPTKAAAKKEEESQKVKDEPIKVTNENFDWSAFEEDLGFYDADKETIATKYEATLVALVQTGEVIEGTVVGLDNREVIVSIGFKSDGVISLSEFRYNPELAVGEKIEVYVESAEDRAGQLILSHKKARQLKSWDRVNVAHDTGEIIKGYIKCRTKGGMIVDVFGIEAFLPGSQIDVRPIRDYDMYVDKTMEFKVIKINHEFRNVVVSHKALIEAELEAQRKEIMAKLEKGQILEGTVKNITSYGVFIDLGGVDGLVHITDLSWGRVNHPEEVVGLDEKVNVVILDFDDQKKRIALGIKQLTKHPWDSLSEELKVGDQVKGKVVVMADYGAFVEISQGVEGLIHVSEMSWSQHLRSAQEFLKVGDEVDAVVLTLDREERKMSLGIKQLTPDPWDGIEQRYPVGTKHTAKVRNFTNFGVFAELEEGIDGLIHISDLSWTKKIKHPEEFTKIGAGIDVIILEVDVANRRLSLGHKQTGDNPWDKFEQEYTVDSVHQGTITEMNDKGAVVEIAEDVEGFAPTRQLAKEDGTMPKEGDKLEFKILEFSKATRRIVLSHSRIHDEIKRAEENVERAEKKASEESAKTAVRKLNQTTEKTTLGDISELAELKAQMLEADKEPAKKAPAKKAPAKKEPVKEEPAKEEPVKEKPAKEEPVKEKPAKEEPVKEEPAKEEPVKEEPAKEEPVKEEPAKEEPAKEE